MQIICQTHKDISGKSMTNVSMKYNHIWMIKNNPSHAHLILLCMWHVLFYSPNKRLAFNFRGQLRNKPNKRQLITESGLWVLNFLSEIIIYLYDLTLKTLPPLIPLLLNEIVVPSELPISTPCFQWLFD